MLSFVAAPSTCAYLPGQLWQLRYDVSDRLTPAEYAERLQRGWRRFGTVMFRPECPSCRQCRSLRVPVETFRASKSQQRAWKINRESVSLTVGSPVSSPAHRALYDKFHRRQSREKGWPDPEPGGADTFLDNPFATEEWRYSLDGRLVGVGYVDRLPQALSAVYFYYDPDERSRSLGTFNVLSLIERAGLVGLPHVYLGYYVEGCRSLAYKAAFQPNEVLDRDGSWAPFRRRTQPNAMPERRQEEGA
jgi:arginyl-tRNA--protein-N-Asp/Glu arginylyltransferase